MTLGVVVRFLKNPYPEMREWDCVVGKFDLIFHFAEGYREFPKYPDGSYRVVAAFNYAPRSWPRIRPRRVAEWPLWRIVAALETKAYQLRWYYELVYAVGSNAQKWPIDVKDGWEEVAPQSV
jgi:hypothetical protein